MTRANQSDESGVGADSEVRVSRETYPGSRAVSRRSEGLVTFPHPIPTSAPSVDGRLPPQPLSTPAPQGPSTEAATGATQIRGRCHGRSPVVAAQVRSSTQGASALAHVSRETHRHGRSLWDRDCRVWTDCGFIRQPPLEVHRQYFRERGCPAPDDIEPTRTPVAHVGSRVSRGTLSWEAARQHLREDILISMERARCIAVPLRPS